MKSPKLAGHVVCWRNSTKTSVRAMYVGILTSSAHMCKGTPRSIHVGTLKCLRDLGQIHNFFPIYDSDLGKLLCENSALCMRMESICRSSEVKHGF